MFPARSQNYTCHSCLEQALECRDQTEYKPVALGNGDLVFGCRIVNPLPLGKAGFVSDGVVRHYLIVGIDDEGDHLNLGDAGLEFISRGPLQLQAHRHRHLDRAIVFRFTEATNAVKPDIDNLAGLVHLHERARSNLRSGNLRASDIVGRAGAPRQKQTGGETGGDQDGWREDFDLLGLAFHAAHPICFSGQQQLTSDPQSRKNNDMNQAVTKDRKFLHLAAPRGFCAGVDRAVRIVEVALEKFGAPVYVRHEIVHNRTVVDGLAAKGALFVKELDEVPEGAPVVFSAHGVARAVVEEADRRNMIAVDATCPLVTKVHLEARRHASQRKHILLIGHAGHTEVEGTMGQVETGDMTLIETVEDARSVTPPEDAELAFATQTTLSVDDTAEIISVLQFRFPDITGPRGEDICYATTNRQNAVKHIAPQCDIVLVVGAENSSNSKRLVEVATRAGAARGRLVADSSAIDWDEIDAARHIGLSAGASAPESLIHEIIDEMRARYDLHLDEDALVEESITFKLPPILADRT